MHWICKASSICLALIMAATASAGAKKPIQIDDLYRLEESKQAEHWDVLETIPPSGGHQGPAEVGTEL